MGASNSERKNAKFYSLKAKVDAQNTPHFALSEKIDGKWQTTGKFDQMEGTLVKAEIREKEYDGAKQNIFVLTLKDSVEESVVSMTHNQLSHSIINTLSSYEGFGPNLMIRLYCKEKHDSASGKTFWNANAYIEADGHKLNWGIQPTDAPKSVPVFLPSGEPFIQNGKQVFDSSERRKFYEDLFMSKVVTKVGSPSVASKHTMTADEFIKDINEPVERVDIDEVDDTDPF